MGKLISFGADEQGVGKTTLLCVFANHFLKKYPDKKILILCANLSKGDLISMMGAKEDRIELGRLVNFRQAWGTSQIAPRKRAYYSNACFVDTKNTGVRFLEKNYDGYISVLNDLMDQFDLVFADIPLNNGNQLSQEILKRSYLKLTVSSIGVKNEKFNLQTNNLTYDNDIGFSKVRICFKDGIDLKEKEYQIPYCFRLEELKERNRLENYPNYQTAYNHFVEEILRVIESKLGLISGCWEDFALKNKSKHSKNKNRAALVQNFLSKRTIGEYR